ncbi:uracil-DNA glycosylase [Pseudomonas syringae]|uniref:uracil-DNA glycosylase n=1 Tax=Pseudomonas syringae TaxID=317 RepID=UPI000F3B2A9C|nr:uracil-DNA glycosylase [Pseudomonas syringae]RML69602.1 hypothetical protein ALQ91_03289 [Pseudomonas syringae pv. syringae]
MKNYLQAVSDLGTDTIWMGRDLGYRGGRRTGLALTDEYHLSEMTRIYPGCDSQQATHGPAIAERTAAEIWAVLKSVDIPPLLWNVFPFHPHEPGNPFTNRKFSSKELALVDELNSELFSWLRIGKIIAIGQDAAHYASRFGLPIETIRHPSYGGVRDFRAGMAKLYDLRPQISQQNRQTSLL